MIVNITEYVQTNKNWNVVEVATIIFDYFHGGVTGTPFECSLSVSRDLTATLASAVEPEWRQV